VTDPFSLDNLEAMLLEAGKDEPSVAELTSYKNLFQQIRTTQPSFVSRLSRWVQAQLVWDSRQEPALQGMRSAGQSDYRLRYTTGYTNIELAVAHEGRLHHIEGEIISATDNNFLFDTDLALITLLRHGQVVAETNSDIDGRFGFADLVADQYAITLDLADRSHIELVTVNVRL